MILRRLQYVLDTGKAQAPGINAFIEDFFISVSGTRSLAPLVEIWPGIGPDQLKRHRRFSASCIRKPFPTCAACCR
jgi:hypothetical protein